jgi:hypothetical protein
MVLNMVACYRMLLTAILGVRNKNAKVHGAVQGNGEMGKLFHKSAVTFGR